jgi:nucleoside-diphosphate-sugar epimerase
MPKALVTGGAGYFGEILIARLLELGWDVSSLDINPTSLLKLESQYLGDIRNIELCKNATKGMDVVFHNVAQVPLAKNEELFFEVNVTGTRNILEAAFSAGVENFVYTSSSAVFGIPENLPVNRQTSPKPIESYGIAKLQGENLCKTFFSTKMQIKIVRPRTILGAGRMGIFSLLFQWIHLGLDIYLLGQGRGSYQFVSARDLANGIVASTKLTGDRIFNLGARQYKNFVEDLDDLCRYAATRSQVRSIPEVPFRFLLRGLAKIRILPFAPYQLLLYGKPMYFDSNADWKELCYEPIDSNLDCLIQGYDWYLQHNIENDQSSNLSVHKKGVKGIASNVLTLALRVVKFFTR